MREGSSSCLGISGQRGKVGCDSRPDIFAHDQGYAKMEINPSVGTHN